MYLVKALTQAFAPVEVGGANVEWINGTLDDVTVVPLYGTGNITGTVKVIWSNMG